jgi:hypothetical protein
LAVILSARHLVSSFLEKNHHLLLCAIAAKLLYHVELLVLWFSEETVANSSRIECLGPLECGNWRVPTYKLGNDYFWLS